MSMNEQVGALVEAVREQSPLVHHITNYVTVNDCANITLAIGASPIMADDPKEAGEIAAMASALVINMGTLNSRTVDSMILAGQSANGKGTPVIFDPVGAGASAFRNETAVRILSEVKVCVLRGNISEIRSIAGLQSETKGVDASQSDMSAAGAAEVAKQVAKKRNCIVAITGKVDIISDGVETWCVENGHPAMAGITGTGCMCSSLVGSFCGAAERDKLLPAVIAAVACMGLAGEQSWQIAGETGNGSLRTGIIDAVSRMDADVLREGANIHEA